MPVTKEFKTIKDQIIGLERRKLKFKNKAKAEEMLKKYNYFDLINGFESFLMKQGVPNKEYENVYFEDFVNLFLFDMELKKHVLFLIFDIEYRLRTSIAYNFSSIHCNTIPNTLNYTKSSCYQAPSPSNPYLVDKFTHFDFFKTTQYNHRGQIRQLSFVDSLKKEKDYIREYNDPPFWVVIKAVPFGCLYYTFLFLDNNVKSLVLNDFGFSLSNTNAFSQALFILKEMRNQCAHLELVTRFRQKRDINQNYFNDITKYAGLSRLDLNFMDVIKILKVFVSINSIKWTIVKFYIKMCLMGRRKIALKILSKMGRRSIASWIRL